MKVIKHNGWTLADWNPRGGIRIWKHGKDTAVAAAVQMSRAEAKAVLLWSESGEGDDDGIYPFRVMPPLTESTMLALADADINGIDQDGTPADEVFTEVFDQNPVVVDGQQFEGVYRFV